MQGWCRHRAQSYARLSVERQRPTMTVQHRELAAGRWATLSLAEQLGNIGSEISQAIAWKPKNAGVSERALHRVGAHPVRSRCHRTASDRVLRRPAGIR
jgi:hypothetical protein